MSRELKPCGTVSAYQRHLRHGETPCDACREASRDSRREYNLKRYGVRERPRAECGTNSGYTAHRWREEQPCADCRAARAAYEREARVVRNARKAARS